MNEASRISDREVTDMLRRRSARPAPAGLASAILESLASERARNPARTTGRSAKRPLMLLAAAALLLGGGALAAASGALRLWSTVPPDPRSAFVGTWVSTSDADGGTQTMTVTLGAERSVAIVVTDTVATVCSGTSSTMTGRGTVDGDSLVIATPDYRCDDGSEAQAVSGPPLEEQLRNLTYRRDAAQDILTAGGGIWLREGAAPPSYEPTASPGSMAASGGMWPQSTLEEVHAAQAGADAGDTNYTWQLDARIFKDDTWINDSGYKIELVDRFLREVLGWDAYTLNPFEGMARDGAYDVFYDQRYLRCAPGRSNSLYPDESCAPTIDGLHYESVSVDLAQLDRQDQDGIWVVNRWRTTPPFAQADPVAVEAQARERLEAFLAARVTGHGAEGLVQAQAGAAKSLLYTTTSGQRYKRYEIERVDGPRWPGGGTVFSARLFTDGDATVVEQRIAWDPGTGLTLDANSTTENGQSATLTYTSNDGEVTVSAPSATWNAWLPGKGTGDVWFGALWHPGDGVGNDSPSIGLVDPVAYDAWCAASGGSPLLSAPADAASIAQQVIADPNFEATAPVAARIGGLDTVSMDVALAPGGRACGIWGIEISRWIHELQEHPELRMRLFLVDLPEGMSVKTLAITVKAPEARFEAYLAEATPIIESIQFHPGAGAASTAEVL